MGLVQCQVSVVGLVQWGQSQVWVVGLVQCQVSGVGLV